MLNLFFFKTGLNYLENLPKKTAWNSKNSLVYPPQKGGIFKALVLPGTKKILLSKNHWDNVFVYPDSSKTAL